MSYKEECDKVVLSRSVENHIKITSPGGESPKNDGICIICGKPLPPGEEVFNFHGYSGDCPKD